MELLLPNTLLHVNFINRNLKLTPSDLGHHLSPKLNHVFGRRISRQAPLMCGGNASHRIVSIQEAMKLNALLPGLVRRTKIQIPQGWHPPRCPSHASVDSIHLRRHGHGPEVVLVHVLGRRYLHAIGELIEVHQWRRAVVRQVLRIVLQQPRSVRRHSCVLDLKPLEVRPFACRFLVVRIRRIEQLWCDDDVREVQLLELPRPFPQTAREGVV